MGLNRELDGLLVVSVEQAVAAPYCGLLLADAGARVIKVERPQGDFARSYDGGANGHSSFFAWLNRGKESISLDLNHSSDTDTLRTLLRSADVFLHNLAPGALARRGFTGQRLRAENQGLICCDISGYGNSGEAAQKKAYDFLIQAEAGVCAVTGSDEPARVGLSISDLSTGLTAFSAILRALIQRGRTAEGVDLSISMFDVLADWMNMPLLASRYGPGAPPRTGMAHALLTPYGAYDTLDGQVLIAVQNSREWRTLCTTVLDDPAMADDPRFAQNADRLQNRQVMDQQINAVFSQLHSNGLIARLNTAGIANAQIRSVEQLSSHPFLRNARAFFAEAELQMADLPVRSDTDRHTDVPQLDQHGDAIRAEFGAEIK